MPLSRPLSQFALVLAGILVFVTFSAEGCSQEQMVYQRPVAELNAKAKQLMDGGQPQEAIGRLESALDLLPDEPATKYNLAVAYQQAGQYDQSLALFDDLLKHNEGDKNTLLKSMAVTYEAQADDAIAKSQAGPAPAPPKLSDADVKALTGKAIDNYKIAIQYYQKAADGLGNTEAASQLKSQADALNQKITQLSSGKPGGNNQS